MQQRRLIGLGLVILLATTTGGRHAAAVPPAAHGQPVDIEDRVWLSGSRQVCINAEFHYDVEVYRWAIYADGTSSPLGAVRASIRVTISGGGGSGGTIRLFGPTSFPARFSSAGTYTITATATGTPAGPRGMVAMVPATMVIDAYACRLSVETVSIWYHLPFGFRPWVGGYTPPVKFDMSQSGLHVESVAFSAFAIAAPYQGCIPTFKATGVDVEFVVTPKPDHIIHIEATYSKGNSRTDVVCGGIVQGGRDDTFSVNAFAGDADEPTLGNPTVKPVVPHRAQASSQINGLTYVIITALP